MYRTDVETYRGIDSGCRQASQYLGRQSSCEFCPFPLKCIIGMRRNIETLLKDQGIYGKIKSGMSVAEVARLYRHSTNSIYKAIERAKRDIRELGI